MSDRMKKIFSFGLPFVSCVIAVFFLLPYLAAKHGLFPVLPSGVYPRRQRGGEKPLLR